MNNKQIIDKTADFVKDKLEDDSTGHDWWHVERVWKNTKLIARSEGIDPMLPELAALLHDIADWKFYDGDETVGPRIAREWLSELGMITQDIDIVVEAIEDVSFKGARVGDDEPRSKVGEIVQDADRLEAIGATGIARCFAYGGHVGNKIFDPSEKIVMHETKEEYRSNNTSSINHFYEKLLLLKDLMNTNTGREMAERRHKYMEEFLEEFMYEEGK